MSVKAVDQWFLDGIETLKRDHGFKTDQALAEVLMVSRPSMSAFKRGTERPSVRAKFIMANLLGMMKSVEGMGILLRSTVGEETGALFEAAIQEMLDNASNKQ